MIMIRDLKWVAEIGHPEGVAVMLKLRIIIDAS